jgi:hypothetical protein
MHKKKNSASVLAGEMILTFFKPKRASRNASRSSNGSAHDPVRVLSEVFDGCLRNGLTAFTSEALFNRLIIELWQRRALACLSLGRDEFASQLEKRGWTYDTKTHLWNNGKSKASRHGELALFGS